MKLLVSAIFLLLSLVVLFPFSGCGSTTAENGAETEPHIHGENDALVWPLKEKIEGTDYEVWLGHHGEHFHAGEMIEPAAIVTKAGEPLENIRISFHEGPNNPNVQIYGGAPMIFEPKTPEEPAHYAGMEMTIPADVEGKLVICFQVELPADAGGQIVRDVDVKIGH